ncbi:MAG: hypothetical protein QHJ73_15930, partial [Armatimonadota bacterium]|nr:hypothetical protein [Armatimonadota bacterium]
MEAKVGASDAVDPVLALLDFAYEWRRRWGCWLVGGPAAVDDLSLHGVYHTAGVRLNADFECESVRQVSQLVHAPRAHHVPYYQSPQPKPPPHGSFLRGTQLFPLA